MNKSDIISRMKKEFERIKPEIVLLPYYADTHGKFGASSTFSLVTTGITTGILTKVTDDTKLGY